jgi:hypothetical protein
VLGQKPSTFEGTAAQSLDEQLPTALRAAVEFEDGAVAIDER